MADSPDFIKDAVEGRDMDPRDLEPYFSQWMLALTQYDLRRKAEIALVLAYQSRMIDEARGLKKRDGDG